MSGRGLILAAPESGSGKTLVAVGLLRHLAGVVFNRVAGLRHRILLEAATARHLPDLRCLGAVPGDSDLVLPERHLGLVPAGEQASAETIIARAATAVADGVAIEQLLALA